MVILLDDGYLDNVSQYSRMSPEPEGILPWNRASVAWEAEKDSSRRDTRAMEIPAGPRLLSAERLDNAVIITFDDGKCGLYSASLLYSILSQAKEIEGSERDDE